MKDNKLIWKLWYYFRRGHGNYLAFFMSLGTFTIVAYNLMIKEIHELSSIFTNMTTFLVVFVIIYGLLTTIIGWQDVKRGSFRTESRLVFDKNPRMKEMYDNVNEINERIKKLENK